MKPLADLRIIAIEQYGAGPFGSVHLADLGAEVIKIEEPASGGDVGRYVPPYQHGEDSLFFEVFNRNKRSVSRRRSGSPTTTSKESIHRSSVAR
jgi:crotonobetainyl-CoA:carnitine CoA-transferase CaiB-like acyl-CoA transferase